MLLIVAAAAAAGDLPDDDRQCDDDRDVGRCLPGVGTHDPNDSRRHASGGDDVGVRRLFGDRAASRSRADSTAGTTGSALEPAAGSAANR